MKHLKPAAAVAAGLAALLLVAACSQSSNSGSSGLAKSAAVDPAGGVNGSADSGASAGGGAVPGASPSRAASAPLQDAANTTLVSPALIRTATLTVTVTSAAGVNPAADRAEQIALAAGGQVDSDDRSSGPDATATLSLKVPGADLTGVLTKLSGLGTQVSREVGTKDVTSELVDVTSRVASARAAIAQLNDLYRRASKVSDVISVETTLSQREADLESLEAQQHALQGQTALATVNLNLSTKAPAKTHKHHAAGGFIGGLRTGWHGFTATAVGVAAAIGAVLPFAIVLLILAAAAVVFRRRLRTMHPGAPGGPSPEPDSV
jgi:Domain of unknown function (DUF4349)